MTVAQISEEVKKLPSDEKADLIDRLLAHVRAAPNPEIEKAWNEEIARRVEDLDAGRARLVSADDVFARTRNALLPAEQAGRSSTRELPKRRANGINGETTW